MAPRRHARPMLSGLVRPLVVLFAVGATFVPGWATDLSPPGACADPEAWLSPGEMEVRAGRLSVHHVIAGVNETGMRAFLETHCFQHPAVGAFGLSLEVDPTPTISQTCEPDPEYPDGGEETMICTTPAQYDVSLVGRSGDGWFSTQPEWGAGTVFVDGVHGELEFEFAFHGATANFTLDGPNPAYRGGEAEPEITE